MLDYLEKYNINIQIIENNLDKNIIKQLYLMRDNVKANIELLKSLKVNNLEKLLLNRPDFFLNPVNNTQNKVLKLDLNLLNYIIEKDTSLLNTLL